MPTERFIAFLLRPCQAGSNALYILTCRHPRDLEISDNIHLSAANGRRCLLT